MKRWLGVLGLVLVGLATLACQNEDQGGGTTPSVIVISNTNTNTIEGPTTPSASPSPGSAIARVTMGCFLMRDATGAALPECGAGLADYICANPPCTGVMNATPLDAQGVPVQGACVQGWSQIGDCTVDDQAGCTDDAFTPGITINRGTCIVSVLVAGVPGGPRKFVGQ